MKLHDKLPHVRAKLPEDDAGAKLMRFDDVRGKRYTESVAYRPISGKRDTQLGINKGSPAFILDDPEGDSWVMKSASRIVDPSQTCESLKDLGGGLEPAPGWKFRAVVLEQDLVLTADNGAVKITQDELGNRTTGSVARTATTSPEVGA